MTYEKIMLNVRC